MGTPLQKTSSEKETSIPISSINTYLYCPRRAGLMFIELAFAHNHHTVRGKIIHERVDHPGSHNLREVLSIRSLPVWSQRLKVHGRCDVVEKHLDGSLVPVEYKKGVFRTFKNDDAQVCAQGLCLEEMFDIHITHGVIFHSSSKRRRRVPFTSKLRAFTTETIKSIHDLIASQQVPEAIHSRKCPGCSLNNQCLPKMTDRSSWSYSKKRIFAPRTLKKQQAE